MTGNEHDSAEERFAGNIGKALRVGAGELDAATLARLNRARQAALAELDRAGKRPAWARSAWQPAIAMAAAALVTVTVWIAWVPRAPRDGGVPAIALQAGSDHAGELELMLADENLDMLEEDPDFYEWLESGADPEQGDATHGSASTGMPG